MLSRSLIFPFLSHFLSSLPRHIHCKGVKEQMLLGLCTPLIRAYSILTPSANGKKTKLKYIVDLPIEQLKMPFW